MKHSPANLSLVLILVFVFSSPVFAQVGSRSKSKSPFGIGTILERFDINKNGKLDPSEMKGRTKDIVKKAGLNPNQSHAIQTIAQKLENMDAKKKTDEKNKKAAGGGSESARKVPGFGVEVEKFGVADFSPSGEERMTVAAMKRKFGDSIMKQVERAISRYDKDKNGLIDRSEQKRSRWTNPSAEDSDTNSDGNLSRLELAYRYKKREDDAMKQRARKSSAPSSTVSRNSSSRKPTTGRTSSSSSRYSRSNRGRSTSSTTTASKTKKPFNSGSDAYRRYAEGLLKNYDKNKDNKLSKSELSEMRRPPENADKNKDGFVDRNELIASVDRRSASRTSGSDKNQKAPTADRLKRDSRKSYSKSDSVFGSKDANNDGQLQMHEYEKNWTAEKIAEFKDKDLNNDGVITADEWKS